MAAELERQGRHIIHMGIGEPDFTAAPSVQAAAAQAMADGKMQYTSATGLPELRAAIARHYRDKYGVTVAPSRIIITAGASGALLLACAALVEKGARVRILDNLSTGSHENLAGHTSEVEIFEGDIRDQATCASDHAAFPARD